MTRNDAFPFMPDAVVTPLFRSPRMVVNAQRVSWIWAAIGAIAWASAVLSGGLYNESSWGS